MIAAQARAVTISRGSGRPLPPAIAFMKYLLLLLAASVALAAVPPAEKLLPASTLAFFTVPNAAQAQSNYAASALGQLWNDPAMKPFKDKFVAKFNTDALQGMEKELGLKLGDYAGLAQGQFTLAVVQNGWDARSDQQPGFIWIVDAQEKSAQLATNLAALRKKWADEGKKMRPEKIREVEFTTVTVDPKVTQPLRDAVPGPKTPPAPDGDKPAAKPVEWVIGQSGSLLILSDAAKDVEKVIALQSGATGVAALGDQGAFLANGPMPRDAQFFLWGNVNSIMRTLAKTPATPKKDDAAFGVFPSVDKILSAIGLSGVQSIAFNLTQSADGSLAKLSLNVPEGSRKGLFEIMAVEPKDSSPPSFVPGDAVKFSRWRIDLQQGWTTLENIFTEISPATAGLTKLMIDTAGKDKDPKFDLRKQLLANLGDDIITYQKSPRSQTAEELASPPALTLLGARNAEQLADSLKTVTGIFPPQVVKYREREFLGRKIYSVTIPMGGDGMNKPLNYAANGGYVAFSTDSMLLEEYLRGSEGITNSLRDFPGFKEAAARAGGTGHGYFSFENHNETARAAFETVRKDPQAAAKLLGGGQWMGAAASKGTGLTDWMDFSLLPEYSRVAKYFHMNAGAIGVTPDAITFQLFAPTPPLLKK